LDLDREDLYRNLTYKVTVQSKWEFKHACVQRMQAEQLTSP